MSYLIVEPTDLTTTASTIGDIGKALNSAHMAASDATINIAPAASDEISHSIASMMSKFGSDAQSAARLAATVNDSFIQQLHSAANWYSTAEPANNANVGPIWAHSAGANPAGTSIAVSVWYAITNALVLAWTIPFFLLEIPIGSTYLSLAAFVLSANFLASALAQEIFYAFGVRIPLVFSAL